MLPVVMPWPEQWAPLHMVRPVIEAALVVYECERIGEPHIWFEDWRWLLFFHWESYWIELRGRPRAPEADPRILHHPEAERRGHLYDLAALEDARLEYRGNPPSYYDLHARGRLAAPDRTNVTVQRAELMFAVWSAAGYPPWDAPDAVATVRDVYPNHPLFKDRTSRVWRDAWSVARGMRRD